MLKVHFFTKSLLVILVSSFMVQEALSSQEETIAAQIARLKQEYGKENSGGVYYSSKDNKIVLNIPNNVPAPNDLPNNVETRTVVYSLSELEKTKKEIIEKIKQKGIESRIESGVAIALALPGNFVEVSVGPSATPASLRELKDLIKKEDEKKVKIRYVKSQPKVANLSSQKEKSSFNNSSVDMMTFGGQSIYKIMSEEGDKEQKLGKCTIGLNVFQKNEPMFLTAGHCGEKGTTWYLDIPPPQEQKIGLTTKSMLGGKFDYSLVKYDKGQGGSPTGSYVDLHDGAGNSQRITRFEDAEVGIPVMKSGGDKADLIKGEVTKTDVTLLEQGFEFTGFIETDVCGQEGDSGSPLFYGNTAYGLLHAGEEHDGIACENLLNPVVYFSPIKQLAEENGLSLSPDR